MNFDNGTWWTVVLIIGAITSSLTYLIKVALFSRVDKLEEKLNQIEKNTVEKNENEKDISEIKTDIETIKKNYTPTERHTKDFDECRNDIKTIRENYITKDDFLREISKQDRKLENIEKMLIELIGRDCTK